MIISIVLFRLTVIIRNKAKHDELLNKYLYSPNESEVNAMRNIGDVIMAHLVNYYLKQLS